MAQQVTDHAGVRGAKDPDLITLILGIIGGVAGLSALQKRLEDAKERRLRAATQRAVRKNAQKYLYQLFADLREWKELSSSARGFFLTSDRTTEQAEFRLGGAVVRLPDPEIRRFLGLTDRIQKLQKSTTRAASQLQDSLVRLEAVRLEEVSDVAKFRESLTSAMSTFNANVFARPTGRTSVSPEYQSMEGVIDALDQLLIETSKALHDLEALLGRDYDDRIWRT
jgi:hypothetical protein